MSGFSDRTVEKNEESRYSAVFLGKWVNTLLHSVFDYTEEVRSPQKTTAINPGSSFT